MFPIQLQAQGLPLASALHTLTCVQVLLGLSKFTPFPFSHSIEALVLVGGTVVNKEGS